MNTIQTELFLEIAKLKPVIDVRSPAEFIKGHIPGSQNIPVFENHERALIGTLYKQRGRDPAIQRGLEVVGPKMAGYIQRLKEITSSKEILIHCWRGGMRSESMGWLFEKAGFEVNILEGGYKNFRRYIREQLGIERKLMILGGMTGSGKTIWLNRLADAGEQIVDLEKLARHRGSVFGGVGKEEQPSTEQFENDLYATLSNLDPSKTIWLEDESRRIGKIFIPEPFYIAMVDAPMVQIIMPDKMRVKVLVDEYGKESTNELSASIRRLTKRLGHKKMQQALDELKDNNFEEVVELLLPYYDKLYVFDLEKRPSSRRREAIWKKAEEHRYTDLLIKMKNELIF